MSKRIAFIALLVLLAVFAGLGRRWQANFLSDLWSQLFWLTLGTLATTFVLAAILERDAHARQRSRDAFAFRTFSANILNALHGMVGLEPKSEKLFEAALSGDKQFEAAALDVASMIEQSSSVEPSTYLKYYLDVAGGLRDLSRNYIRLFSANRTEMLAHYRELNDLANHWDYKDEFSERSRDYTASIATTDPDRLAHEASLQGQLASARGLVVSTARQLAKLAAKNATGKGFYD
jgi:hypothetical protein